MATLAARVAWVVHAGNAAHLSAEGPVLYSIWKIRHGYPLYESPFAAPFSVSLYNFLSYHTYAAALDLFHVADRSTPAAARIVTALFAAAGIVLQYAGARALPAVRRVERSIAVTMAALTWCGTVLPAGWSFAIRPDTGAIVFDLAGILLVLQALGGRGGRRLTAAGVLFFIAWGFKQTQIVIVSATVAYLLVWRRSWRDAARVGVPFTIGVIASLALGGAVYRQNIIAAPALSPLVPLNAWFAVRTIALPDALFWALAAGAMPLLFGSPEHASERSLQRFGVDVSYPLLLTLAAAAAALPMLAKAGSAINHAIELKACAGLVAAAALGARSAAAPLPPRRARVFDAVVFAAAALMIGSTVSRLRAEYPSLAAGAAGRDAAIPLRQRAAARIAELPPPVYADDELYALPWIANADRYPAVLPDFQVYHAAMDAGVLSDTVEAMVSRRAFASVAVADTSPVLALAAASGYKRVGVLPQAGGPPIVLMRRQAAAGTR